MDRLIFKLSNIFDNLNPDIAYLAICNDGYEYRQINKTSKIDYLNFDLPKSAFLSYKDIIKNKEVLAKIIDYMNDKQIFISMTIYKYGYEVRVYNKFGHLIYHQFIKLVSTYNIFITSYYSKKFPELTLK